MKIKSEWAITWVTQEKWLRSKLNDKYVLFEWRFNSGELIAVFGCSLTTEMRNFSLFFNDVSAASGKCGITWNTFLKFFSTLGYFSCPTPKLSDLNLAHLISNATYLNNITQPSTTPHSANTGDDSSEKVGVLLLC